VSADGACREYLIAQTDQDSRFTIEVTEERRIVGEFAELCTHFEIGTR